MKRTIVLLGVLAAFLFAAFGAYAAEHSTWGRIKSDFVDESSVRSASSSAQPQFLTRPDALAKPGGPSKDFFYAEKKIDAKEGGKLEVGDRKSGMSKLVIPEKALAKDKTISIKVPKYGDLVSTISEVTFGEHGIVFDKPAQVKLSYKGADLKDVDEKEICVWYWHEEIGEWECIGGEVDIRGKKVIFYINHFSRYALGAR